MCCLIPYLSALSLFPDPLSLPPRAWRRCWRRGAAALSAEIDLRRASQAHTLQWQWIRRLPPFDDNGPGEGAYLSGHQPPLVSTYVQEQLQKQPGPPLHLSSRERFNVMPRRCSTKFTAA